jgi:signal transduction histidine kinase
VAQDRNLPDGNPTREPRTGASDRRNLRIVTGGRSGDASGRGPQGASAGPSRSDVDDEGSGRDTGRHDADSSGQSWSGKGRLGLPAKLLVLTVLFVMLAEVLIFVPSIANFRVNWLKARLTSARLAALAATAAPGGKIPQGVRRELLSTAQVRAVAIKKDRMRWLVLPSEMPLAIDASFDLRERAAPTWWEASGKWAMLIADAVAVFFADDARMIRVYGRPMAGLDTPVLHDEFVEVVLPEGPLKAAMIQYGLNVLGLSIIISMIAAALVYFALIQVLVRPMMRLTRNMLHFSERPEDADRIIVPSDRGDEIGIAERELRNMQEQLAQALNQKNRLAQLGLAVSKINHDLRNMLASAQLMSDRLASLPDPTVQRFAPKLIASLDRAIAFCNSSLTFGRAQEAPPRREVFGLRGLVDEVGEGLDLPRAGLDFVVEMSPTLQIDADRDYLHRVLNNICRNSVQAILSRARNPKGTITVRASREGRRVEILISDDGPGVPKKARAHLFQAFQGGVRKGGSGLGLAISAELVAALGGRLSLCDAGGGATFRIVIPDREAGRPGK